MFSDFWWNGCCTQHDGFTWKIPFFFKYSTCLWSLYSLFGWQWGSWSRYSLFILVFLNHLIRKCNVFSVSIIYCSCEVTCTVIQYAEVLENCAVNILTESMNPTCGFGDNRLMKMPRDRKADGASAAFPIWMSEHRHHCPCYELVVCVFYTKFKFTYTC